MSRLETEIEALPNHFSFYHWLTLKIETAKLPIAETKQLSADLLLAENTPEAQYQTMQFVEYATSVYAVTHADDPFTPLDFHSTMKAINEIWRKETEEILRIRAIPK